MTKAHRITPNETGMIRIYMKPSDKSPTGKSFWSSKPLYRELVRLAKTDGIMNAIAHHTHYGFSNHGPVMEDGAELSNPHLTMCVELIGSRAQLEAFCSRHGEQLASKVIVYKHLEHWSVTPTGIAHEDAPTEEFLAEKRA